jgi:hypothetical protein
MSKEVKRYFVDCNWLHAGDQPSDECDVRVVIASDYEALLEENEALKSQERYREQELLAALEEVERLRAMTDVTCGVGDGKLFVHGDYDSIKKVQSLVFELESLRKDAERYQWIR